MELVELLTHSGRCLDGRRVNPNCTHSAVAAAKAASDLDVFVRYWRPSSRKMRHLVI